MSQVLHEIAPLQKDLICPIECSSSWHHAFYDLISIFSYKKVDSFPNTRLTTLFGLCILFCWFIPRFPSQGKSNCNMYYVIRKSESENLMSIHPVPLSSTGSRGRKERNKKNLENDDEMHFNTTQGCYLHQVPGHQVTRPCTCTLAREAPSN
jgi:hypothetical protein